MGRAGYRTDGDDRAGKEPCDICGRKKGDAFDKSPWLFPGKGKGERGSNGCGRKGLDLRRRQAHFRPLRKKKKGRKKGANRLRREGPQHLGRCLLEKEGEGKKRR